MFKKELKKRWLYVLLALVGLISIITIKFIWNDTPEFFSRGSEMGDVLFDLSVGYISAFIFYIIQIWIPEFKEQKRINDRIALPLNTLLHHMKTPIDAIIKTYGNPNTQFDNIPKAEFIEMVEKIDLTRDEGFMGSVDGTVYSFGQCLYFKIFETKESITKIMNLPLPYKLDFDLLDLLNEIDNSHYHTIMKALDTFHGFQSKITIDPDGQKRMKIIQGDQIAGELYDYYQSFFQLIEYMKNNKMRIREVGL